MKKGLGRGFESLIPTNLLDETFDPTADQDVKISKLVEINIDKIVADPDQPRRHFDEAALDELTASIKEHGVVQPLVVTSKGDDFLIVAGERRWRAAKAAGLKTVPSIVRTLSGQHRLEISLIENLQRRDLNALETATAYLKLRDQFNMTLEQIGQRVGGKSVSAVSNTLRLLKLPKEVQKALFEGELSEGQARSLIGLEEKVAIELMNKIIKEGWSVRRTEQAIAAMKQAKTKEKKADLGEVPHAKTASRLAERFDTKVQIRTNAKGGGRIVIPFKSEEDFKRIKELLN